MDQAEQSKKEKVMLTGRGNTHAEATLHARTRYRHACCCAVTDHAHAHFAPLVARACLLSAARRSASVKRMSASRRKSTSSRRPRRRGTASKRSSGKLAKLLPAWIAA